LAVWTDMFDPVLDKARMGAGFNRADNVLPEDIEIFT